MVNMKTLTFRSFSDELAGFLWPEEDDKQRGKRRRILFAATELFIQLGSRKTTIDAIAKQAAIAKGTIYLYYGNKAEIVLHAIGLEKLNHLKQLVKHIGEDLSPKDILRTYIVVAVVMSRQMPLTASLLRGDQEISFAMQEVDDQLKVLVEQKRVGTLSGLLDDATNHQLPRTRLKALSLSLDRLLNSVFLSTNVFSVEMSPIKYAENLAAMLIDGLINANDQRPSDALKPLYKELSKKIP